MSYDYKLEFEKINFSGLKRIISVDTNITNNVFAPSEKYHMRIDIENEQLISFHIPYVFMNKDGVDHHLYIQTINRIALKLNGVAYDLQEERFLNDPKYIQPKSRKLIPKHHNRRFKKFSIESNKITFYDDEEKTSLVLDLTEFTIRDIKNRHVKERTYPPFSKFKRFTSHVSDDIAIRNWNDKTVRIFEQKEGMLEKDDAEIWEIFQSIQIEKCGKVQNLVFDSPTTMFTISYKSKTLKLWDFEKNKLIRNFSNYSNCIYHFHKLNNKLVFTLSDSGISFFDFETGKIILHIYHLRDSWFCFDENGNFQGDILNDRAYELDYKDNKYSESYCFIPNLGFATFRPTEKWKLYKVKRFDKPLVKTDLLRDKLLPYLKGF